MNQVESDISLPFWWKLEKKISTKQAVFEELGIE